MVSTRLDDNHREVLVLVGRVRGQPSTRGLNGRHMGGRQKLVGLIAGSIRRIYTHLVVDRPEQHTTSNCMEAYKEGRMKEYMDNKAKHDAASAAAASAASAAAAIVAATASAAAAVVAAAIAAAEQAAEIAAAEQAAKA